MQTQIYEGPTAFNSQASIVALLTYGSRNAKTGDVDQLWILPAWTEPHHAVKAGLDASVCGSCKYAGGQGCYVLPFQGPLSVYRSWKRGNANRLVEPTTSAIRLGAYGDPAALPYDVVLALASQYKHTIGYTHAWRTCDPRFKGLLMASVDNAQEAAQADAAGWRYFRVTRDLESRQPGIEAHCASDSAGIQCKDCKHCNGHATNRRGHVVIQVHGATANRAMCD